MKILIFILFFSINIFSSENCDLHFIRKITNPANNEKISFPEEASLLKNFSNYVEELNHLIKEGDLKNNLDFEIIDANISNLLLNQLFTKDAQKSLSMSELKVLKNNEKFKRVLYYTEKLNTLFVIIPDKIKSTLSKLLTSGSGFGSFLHKDIAFFDQIKYKSVDKLLFLLDIVNPIPISHFKTLAPGFLARGNNETTLKSVRKIFKRQYQNPEYQLLNEDLRILEEKNLYEVYVDRGNFLRSNSLYFKVKKFGEFNLSILMALSSIAVVDFAMTLSSNQVELDDYIDKGSLEDNSIQIIVDEEPFPHLALRVGDYIYSYGMEKMTRTHFKKYLRSATMQDWMAIRGYDKESDSHSSANIKSKLPGSAHSAIVSTLTIDPKERLKLIDDLESNVNKTYKNITTVNDCATMIVNILKKNTSINIPFIVDSSPNQINLWLNGQQNFEKSSYVQSLEHIITQDSERKKYHFFRTLYLSVLESNVFIKFMPIMKSYQTYLNLSHDEAEIQWFNDYELDYQIKLKEEISQRYKNMPTYKAVKKILKKENDKQCHEIDFLNLFAIVKTFENYILLLDEKNDPFTQELMAISFSQRFEAEVAKEVIEFKQSEISDLHNALIERCL